MKQALLWVSVPAWLLIAATAAMPASDDKQTAEEVMPPEAPAKLTISSPQTSVQQLFDLDLRRWPEERFYENLTGLINEMSLRYGSEATAILLDTAELFLGQMMLAEAESVLEGLEDLPPEQQRRHLALNQARMLLNGESIDEFDESPLTAENRPDRSFWLVLQAIASADGRMLNENLGAGVVGLMHQTRPVARSILPLIIEAMIETEKLELADRSIQLLDSFPDLSEGPLGHYLRGRSAEKRGNQSTALQHYFEGVKGFDRYAVRSRIAIADLAIADGGRGALMAAEDVLEDGLDAWRGDQFEIATLEKLNEVYVAADERVEGLILLSKILMRYPGTPAAERALVQSHEALRAVYEDGFEGRIPLSQWLSVHLRLVPAFRYHPEYAQLVEELGDHLLALGGTSMAAQEYERAIEFRTDLRRITHTNAPDVDLTPTRLKLAKAYTAGGQYAEAIQALAEIDDPSAPAVRNEVNAMRARIAAQLGDTDGLLRTHVMSPSVDNLRSVSRALWQKKEWASANEFYNRLWAEYPGLFDLSDATYLLIAAHKVGDQNTASRVVGAFPGLTESEDWVRLAESFLTAPPDVSNLTLDAANGRLNRLTSTLSNIEGNGL